MYSAPLLIPMLVEQVMYFLFIEHSIPTVPPNSKQAEDEAWYAIQFYAMCRQNMHSFVIAKN